MAGKADIVDQIAAAAGLSKSQAAAALDAALGAVSDSLVNGDRVSLPGFGSFSVGHRPARSGRNPATGATIQIAASNNVKFKAGKVLKAAVN